MKLKLNREYAQRHAFVTLLMAGLGGWFGYDGLVRYPSLSGHDLYVSIEKAEPPPACDLDAFKRQKTQTQYGFATLSLAAALVVGLRLARSARFAFSFDETGFTYDGKTYGREDIVTCDRSAWASKSILKLTLKDGAKVTLDAWHHIGVKDFAETI